MQRRKEYNKNVGVGDSKRILREHSILHSSLPLEATQKILTLITTTLLLPKLPEEKRAVNQPKGF